MLTPISARELFAQLGAKRRLRVIDVREPTEIASGTVPGAVAVRGEALAKVSGEFSVVCVCMYGARSSSAASALSARGVTATYLDGGLHAWVRDGFPLGRAAGQ